MLRNANWLRVLGNLFILVVVLFISFIYYVHTFLVQIPIIKADGPSNHIGRIVYLSVFHVLFFFLVWSFIKTMVTDPGKVPLYWGFYLDDPENKKRRYCLICHIFKPERCHHCSACNRCVLNMDHHCPWVNNCVGFYNRKFFMLLLFYVLTCTFCGIGGMIEPIYDILMGLYHDWRAMDLFQDGLILVGFAMNTTLFFVMFFFFKFHVGLVLDNGTTIDVLEKKRSGSSVSYDYGRYNNWIQCFGENKWLWLIPIYGESGKPVGDGVSWPQRPLISYEIQESQTSR